MSDPQRIFFEAFDGLERLAPGSESSTRRALAIARGSVEPRRILDLGCGSGAQTRVLARDTAAEIVAVDAHAPFLRALEERAAREGHGDRVRTIEARMDELDGRIEAGSFDLLWAEGSIYTIGFDRALRMLRESLRDGGVFACSELTWLTAAPSDAPRRFWGKGYPAMRGVGENLAAAAEAGYGAADHFVLSASDWLLEYYDPLGERVARLRHKYAEDAGAAAVLDGIQAEIDLYRAFGTEYGYVFYILRARTG